MDYLIVRLIRLHAISLPGQKPSDFLAKRQSGHARFRTGSVPIYAVDAILPSNRMHIARWPTVGINHSVNYRERNDVEHYRMKSTDALG